MMSESLSMLRPVLFIALGAALGAIARWQLSERLNATLSLFPLGTLTANLVGAYLIGAALAFFALNNDIPAEWRLLVVSGFCGGLTTFSTFSAEVVQFLQKGQFKEAVLTIALHLFGSLFLTFLGMASVFLWRSKA